MRAAYGPRRGYTITLRSSLIAASQDVRVAATLAAPATPERPKTRHPWPGTPWPDLSQQPLRMGWACASGSRRCMRASRPVVAMSQYKIGDVRAGHQHATRHHAGRMQDDMHVEIHDDAKHQQRNARHHQEQRVRTTVAPVRGNEAGAGKGR